MTSPRSAPRGSAAGDAHPSLRERVYAELRERIIEAEYPAGTRLVEREVAEELRVSRVPVREAMQRLESEGFLSVRPRRGSVVTDCGPEDAEHLFDVRENLEGLAARLAARHARPEELRALEELLARARRAAESGRLREAVSLNADFHRAVVELSGNPLLVELMAPLDSRLHAALPAHLRRVGRRTDVRRPRTALRGRPRPRRVGRGVPGPRPRRGHPRLRPAAAERPAEPGRLTRRDCCARMARM